MQQTTMQLKRNQNAHAWSVVSNKARRVLTALKQPSSNNMKPQASASVDSILRPLDANSLRENPDGIVNFVKGSPSTNDMTRTRFVDRRLRGSSTDGTASHNVFRILYHADGSWHTNGQRRSLVSGVFILCPSLAGQQNVV